jgi:hypothetical protein
MVRALFICLLFFGILFLTAVIGEFFSKKRPKNLFSNWWRKNIIGECEECG